jgi:hypothetical protein
LIIHPSSFCFEGLGPGAHTFTLSVDDAHGGRDDDSVVLTLEDRSIPPEIQVLRPAEGEVVAAGAPYTIRWTASDDRGLARFDLVAFIDIGPNGRRFRFLSARDSRQPPPRARGVTRRPPQRRA